MMTDHSAFMYRAGRLTTLLHAEQRCNVVRLIGAEIDSVTFLMHRCELSISVNPLTVYIAELTVNTMK